MTVHILLLGYNCNLILCWGAAFSLLFFENCENLDPGPGYTAAEAPGAAWAAADMWAAAQAGPGLGLVSAAAGPRPVSAAGEEAVEAPADAVPP